MLEPYIIEWLRRERDGQRQRSQGERPRIELPLEPPRDLPYGEADEVEPRVIIIDL